MISEYGSCPPAARLATHAMLPRRLLPIIASCLALLIPAGVAFAQSPEPSALLDDLKPFLTRYCADCHGPDDAAGSLNLAAHRRPTTDPGDREIWEHVLKRIGSREMPPEDEAQPTKAERDSAMSRIAAELEKFDCEASRRPGRVMIQRLNRVEYNNTIRDLLGIDPQPAKDFPSDDVGAGFDNIGAVLALPPLLIEKYLAAAQDVIQQAWANPAARQRLMVCDPMQAQTDEDRQACFRQILTAFVRRAYRRPPTSAELDRLMQFGMSAWQRGASPEQALQATLSAVLASPNFLFRIEEDPLGDEPDAVRALNDYELASRLSYFLWSSMPDETLFALADAGKLQDPAQLREQALRMLKDPKAEALVKNFAGQWLQLRDLARLQPDPEMFPDFDEALRDAMLRETELFVSNMIQQDLSVLDFLTADYAFVNERLARHYGLEGVRGDEFRRVPSPPNRRGVLTQGSILLLTSNPTRTSPVKRGKWILENLLDDPPPPPLPGVQALEDQPELLGSLRERMEQHRADPQCAVCHRRMDVLGFGLENFDPIGAWRDRDGRFEIDPSGQLPGGEAFATASAMMDILKQGNADEFCRCLTKKMLTYALGRELQPFDRCTIDDILKELKNNDYRFSSLVTAIVVSEPFTQQGRE